jgi:uncharacterized protein YacL
MRETLMAGMEFRKHPAPGQQQVSALSAAVKILTVTAFVMFFNFVPRLVQRVYNLTRPQSSAAEYMNANVEYVTIAGVVLGALIGMALSPQIENALLQTHRQLARALRRYPPQVMASSSIGVVVGLIFATLVSMPAHVFFPEQRTAGLLIAVSCALIFGYLGGLMFSRLNLWGAAPGASPDSPADAAAPKVLDSSVIIDGRIGRLCQERFIEGRILIPSPVLNEIQHIADDTDKVRRERGRNALALISQLRDMEGVNLEVVDVRRDRDSFDESVDAQLVAYAKRIGGVLVTNDFNLTKVAGLRGVRVYNLNLLANEFRKTLLPGDTVEVHVVKYGKEGGQGIAYLDDGTMVVIESGDKFIGEAIVVEVSSIMQTVAGRLIFARVAPNREPTVQ